MKEIHEKILYVAHNLANQNQAITIEALQQTLEWMLVESLDLAPEMSGLAADGYLVEGSDKQYYLTETGRKEAWRINKIRSREEFNRLMDSTTSSQVYLDYCQEIYGYRLYLFNMMDKEQLDYLFNSVPIASTDTVLDLGCGVGSILNSLVKLYNCRGIGIDQLNQALVRRNSDRIAYIEGDLDKLADYNVSPTITLAVDSLYFADDLDKIINYLYSIPNNRLYFYYSQYIFNESRQDNSILQPDNTRLAAALRRNGIPYRIIDYSNNEDALYENALKILPKYKEALIEEGNSDLYESKMKENRSGQEMYAKGLASRYLYIVAR